MHLFDRLLSYITEVHKESVPSSINDDLHLSIVSGRYQLSTNDAIYSWADKYANFKRVFDKMNLSSRPKQKVLVLGLGLGSIPFMLQKMGHRYHYTGIEIDEEVIYLASKYVIDDIETDMIVIQADAAHYIEQCKELFDMITMDIFIGQTVPSKFWNSAFVGQLKRLLKEDGLIIYNTIARTEELKAASQLFYQSAFSPHFDRPAAIPIKGNLMLISNTNYYTTPWQSQEITKSKPTPSLLDPSSK